MNTPESTDTTTVDETTTATPAPAKSSRKRSKKRKADLPAETAIETSPVLLTIKAEHVATPHGIELRRKGQFVTDARTQDFASTQTIGAKSIEDILREAGANPPAGDEQLVISISPHNGDIIAVTKA